MEREIKQEEILNKMRELREKRFKEICDKSKGKTINDYIENVKYLDRIEINGVEKYIYLIEEQHKQEDGSLGKVEKYYTEDGEFLGGNNLLDNYDKVILSEQYRENNDLLEKLQRIEESEKDGKLDLNKEDEILIEEVAKELGIEKEEIKRMCLIDSNEEVTGKEKEEKEENDSNREEDKTISKKQIERVSSKQEIEANERVTDQETMQEILDVEDKNYTKFAIIYSDKLNKNSNTTKYTIVGIKKEGSAEKLDSLEQDYGKNPTKEIYQMNEDGTEIKKQQVNSIYTIKGKKEGQIAIKNGNMGEIKVSYVRTPPDNQKGISIPIKTQNIVRQTTREMQESMNRNRDTDVKDNINRAEEHEKSNCINMQKEDIDDNPYNNTHIHYLTEEQINAMIGKIMKNEEIANAYKSNDTRKRILEEMQKCNDKGEKITIEGLQEKVEKEMEQDAQQEHLLPTRNNR